MSANEAILHNQMHQLYSSHHGWLYALLRRRLGNAFDAADLAHDTFLRLLLKPLDFDSFGGARAYLSTVAKSLCIDLWRRREIERVWLDALAAQPEALAPSAEHRAVILETLFEVDAMLRRLPEKAANAFVMAQIHGMTYKEIAAELAVSERMVKKYMAQAMLNCAMHEAGIKADFSVDMPYVLCK
ncbi:MAG: RNA polymerase subunit sigma [Burkholderiales bacterium RIFCSPLOWO2_02_FULL_57_36]|nr:MAG: RNA polymerase subunit sigma [Burkholderiales bacterium RIFCSPLOWO2_02_FULL_57_36]